MKYDLIINKEKEEQVIIIVNERNEIVDKIEKILFENDDYLLGYNNYDIVKIDYNDISCIFTEDNKVYTYNGNTKYLLKSRIFQLEKKLNDDFIKINQGCIINIKSIYKFESTLMGAIKVVLKNGFSDYISRRELTKVKRRIGL